MTNFLNQNLESLRRNNPSLYETINNLEDVPALSFGNTTNGEPEIFCNFADGSKKSYHEEGQSPLSYSQKIAQSLKEIDARIVFFFGMGFGYHILDFVNQEDPLTQAVIIVEPWPHIFKEALKHNDFTTLIESNRIFFFVGQDPEAFNNFLASFFSQTPWIYYAHSVKQVPFSPAYNLNPNFFNKLGQLIPQAIAHQFNRFFGDPYDGFRGTKNTLFNIKQLIHTHSIDQAKDLFKDKPGVLIASGPSLNLALEELKKIKDQVVTIACPSALPALIKEGITPDIYINIERMEEQGLFLKEYGSKLNSLFVGAPLIHPLNFQRSSGPNAYIKTLGLQSQWLPLNGDLYDIGQSSAHAAFQVLNILGCSQIYLLGQDLAYQEDQSHAENIWDESVQFLERHKREHQKDITIFNYKEEPIKTNIFWYTYLKTFVETLIPQSKAQVFHVIPIDRGAKIPGARRIDPETLSKSIQEQPTFNAIEKINKCFSHAPQETNLKETFSTLLKEVKSTLEGVIKDDLHFSLQAKETLFSSFVRSKNWETAKGPYREFLKSSTQYFNRFVFDSRYKRYKDSYYGFFFPIIQGMMISYFIDFFRTGTDLKGDFQEIRRKCELLYHMAKDEAHWANCLIPHIERTLKQFDT